MYYHINFIFPDSVVDQLITSTDDQTSDVRTGWFLICFIEFAPKIV